VTALFISDLHLDADRPAGIRHFLRFARQETHDASCLYILGDLFEVWVGDDDTDPAHAPVIESLKDLKRRGIPCFFLHGNRDFLIGKRFAAATGCELLAEWTIVDMHGQRLLLTHGDLLCSDDEAYMALRAIVRDPEWQRDFLAKPIEERRRIAGELRARSRTETASKPAEIMDVNQGTVEARMRELGTRVLLHGHTHRPKVHEFSLDGEAATRIVLGAWHEGGSVVRWDRDGFRLEMLER
jgi:UDP-2,3-diacylglucosamine hydrolase